MNEAPKRIEAWVNADGSTDFEGGKLFPKGVTVEYVREDLARMLQDALEELAICVEDGCFCSEMRMAAAIDNARQTLRTATPPEERKEDE
jgi:hypothetical protein